MYWDFFNLKIRLESLSKRNIGKYTPFKLQAGFFRINLINNYEKYLIGKGFLVWQIEIEEEKGENKFPNLHKKNKKRRRINTERRK